MQSPSSLYHDVIFPGGIKTTERGAIDMWPELAVLTSEGVIDADAEYAATCGTRPSTGSGATGPSSTGSTR